MPTNQTQTRSRRLRQHLVGATLTALLLAIGAPALASSLKSTDTGLPERPAPLLVAPATGPTQTTTTQMAPTTSAATPDDRADAGPADPGTRVRGTARAVPVTPDQPATPTEPRPATGSSDDGASSADTATSVPSQAVVDAIPTPTSVATVTDVPAEPVPAIPRCTITYRVDGVDESILGAALAAVSAQAPVDFVPSAGGAHLHIRAYWPEDNPTAAFGWTGDVGGQMSIYLKPLVLNTPDFAARMLVHELGHVLGLDQHTTTGTPMDDMPPTSTFTDHQLDAMVLPC